MPCEICAVNPPPMPAHGITLRNLHSARSSANMSERLAGWSALEPSKCRHVRVARVSRQPDTLGSLTQRYVKRHGTARKGAGVRRFRQFLSPHLALQFPQGFRGGGSHRRRNTSALERVSCSENRGIGNSRISARYPQEKLEKRVRKLCSETCVPIESRVRV